MVIRDLLMESNSASHFFCIYFAKKQSLNERFSLRQWTGRLGYTNPSFLSEVIRGHRKANNELLERFLHCETLQPLERVYLDNLLKIELAKLTSLNVERNKENESIRQYWIAGDWRTDQGDHPADLVIDTLLVKFPDGLGFNQIIQALERFFNKDLLISRIEQGLNNGRIVRQGEQLICKATDGKRRLTPEGFSDFLKTLSAVQTLPKDQHVQAVVACTLSEKGFNQAKEILISAFEKIILISIAEEKNSFATQNTSLHNIYFSLSRILDLNTLSPQSKLESSMPIDPQ